MLVAGLFALAAILGPSSAVAVNDKPPDLVGETDGGDFVPWMGELAAPDEVLDHIIIMWDEIIDPNSIPAPADFSVSLNGVDHLPTAVTLVFAGFADGHVALSDDGTSFVRLDLPFTWTSHDTVLVSYTPGANPIRDLALAQAPAFTDAPATTFDVQVFDKVGPVIDSYYGSDRLLLGTTIQIVPTSIPVPADFEVTVDGEPVGILGVTHLHPDLGIGLLELALDRHIRDRAADVRFSYTPGSNPITNLRDGWLLDPIEDAPVFLVLSNDVVSMEVEANGTVSTANPHGPTVADPIATTLTSPMPGDVSIEEGPIDAAPASGYEFFGQQVTISAPDALGPDEPLVIRFDLDASLVPMGHSHETIEVFRNGVLVPPCADPWVAEPSPCVSERAALTDGDISFTVLTVQASYYNFGIARPLAFGGFLAPVNGDMANRATAGSAIPVKFSLGGFRGMEIFAAGSPSSRLLSCSTLDEGDDIETTVSPGASDLTYDAATDTYTYVWKTQRAWRDTCRKLVVDFNDGSRATADFDFRR